MFVAAAVYAPTSLLLLPQIANRFWLGLDAMARIAPVPTSMLCALRGVISGIVDAPSATRTKFVGAPATLEDFERKSRLSIGPLPPL